MNIPSRSPTQKHHESHCITFNPSDSAQVTPISALITNHIQSFCDEPQFWHLPGNGNARQGSTAALGLRAKCTKWKWDYARLLMLLGQWWLRISKKCWFWLLRTWVKLTTDFPIAFCLDMGTLHQAPHGCRVWRTLSASRPGTPVNFIGHWSDSRTSQLYHTSSCYLQIHVGEYRVPYIYNI